MSEPTNAEQILQEVQAALEKGEKGHARDLLTRLIKQDAANSQNWLWMSAAVETNKEIIYCLNEALRLDPQNPAARRGLILLGAQPADPTLAIPLAAQRRNWESQLFDRSPESQFSRGVLKQVGFVAAAVIVLALLVAGAVFLSSQVRPPVQTGGLFPTFTFGPSVTAEITTTPVVRTVTPTFVGPTPLAMLMAATYTPTPLYVGTPHPRTESFRNALTAYKRGDWTQTVLFLQQVATAESNPADVLYLIGEAYRFQKKYPLALQAYEQALRANLNFAPAYLGRARLNLAQAPEQFELPQRDIEKAISLDPGFGEAYLDLAALKIARKDPKSALKDLESAAKLNPEAMLLFFYRAQAELQNETPILALADAQRANQADFTYLPGYRLLAQALRANQKIAESQAPLEVFTRYVTDDAEAFLWLGLAQLENGEKSAALKSMDQAITVDKNYSEGYLQRGLLQLDLYGHAKALPDLTMAVQLRPDSFAANLARARVTVISGNSAIGIDQFTFTLRLAQTDAEKAQVFYYRAQALETLTRTAQAAADWDALLKLPAAAVPAKWREMALLRWQALVTPTPTGPLPSATRTSSRTPTSLTPTASVTPTP